MLSVTNLHVSYDKIKALHGIDFQINEGEIICIIGANGAGKSTTLRAISRLVPVGKDTTMTFNGQDLLAYPPDKIVSELGITHVPEGRRLFGNLTVLENLRLATFARKDKKQISQDLQKVFSIFSRLEERKDQKSGTLSGGEQQMLAIGRALMSKPKLLMCDEPSLGLAPIVVKSIFEVIKQINASGVSVLLVEQNVRAALGLAQRAYIIENGRVVGDGEAASLLDDERIKEAYLGTG
jgi:branched-chain amino acid transport system ATP-binding protein